MIKKLLLLVFLSSGVLFCQTVHETGMNHMLYQHGISYILYNSAIIDPTFSLEATAGQTTPIFAVLDESSVPIFQVIQSYIDVNSHNVKNVSDPVDTQDVATKNYVDTMGYCPTCAKTDVDETITGGGNGWLIRNVMIGYPHTSDESPPPNTLFGRSACQSAISNITGGDTFIGPGLGQKTIQIADYSTLHGQTLLISRNTDLSDSSRCPLQEGVQFSSQDSNATTALNLAAAINAWCSGVQATANSDTVDVWPTYATGEISISTPYTTDYVITEQDDGGLYILGGYTADPFTIGNDLNIEVAGVTPDMFGAINCYNISAASVSSIAAVTVTGISGGTDGKILYLTFEDGNITINDIAPFILSGAFTSTTGSTLVLLYYASEWREISRSLN